MTNKFKIGDLVYRYHDENNRGVVVERPLFSSWPYAWNHVYWFEEKQVRCFPDSFISKVERNVEDDKK